MTENRCHIHETLARSDDGAEGFRCLGNYTSVAEALERIRHEFPDKERYSRVLVLMVPVREGEERICNAMFCESRPHERERFDLTPHEMRLLKLLVKGHNYTTAALELGVSYNTIKYHTRRMYKKLRVHSKSEAVSRALQNRLID